MGLSVELPGLCAAEWELGAQAQGHLSLQSPHLVSHSATPASLPAHGGTALRIIQVEGTPECHPDQPQFSYEVRPGYPGLAQ